MNCLRHSNSRRILGALAIASVLSAADLPGAALQVGSKKFTESYILGDIAARVLERAGFRVENHPGMGGTIILWQALRGGSIDIYPEYTGTIQEEILKAGVPLSLSQLREKLRPFGVAISPELGFNNTYCLAMREDKARRLGIRAISDLRQHAELPYGLTHEFLSRRDGWEPLRQRYQLAPHEVKGIDHSLGYAALNSGQIDVKDAYSTDAQIERNSFRILQDDQHFFKMYQAVFLYRTSLPAAAARALESLAGALPETKMRQLNAAAESTKSYEFATDLFFGEKKAATSLSARIVRWTLRHLYLVGCSMAAAIAVGIPLGILAAKAGWTSRLILSAASMIQTIPSLALLAVLVALPFLGISALTAVVALFLYSLLPIVQNTAAGLADIPIPIRESAAVLGLSPAAQLMKIQLPIASRAILAGVKTSTIINVGTATLAALIGAGGLGEPIISGLNLNDTATILSGAIPAALLALAVQFLFDWADRKFIAAGLRLKDERR